MALAGLAQAIEAGDPQTWGHSARVSALADVIARRLGYDGSRLAALRVGALLHDVGKLTVDPMLLGKPGPLDERERRAIRTHPIAGARLLRPFPPLRPALPYVLFHHEWWDGNGYPSGRSRERIPFGARILAVADAFDAMTSDRPYRAALPVDVALGEVRRCAGAQFDPSVVHAFLAACAAGDLPEVSAA